MRYTDQQLLERVKTLPGFKDYPKGYWFIAVRNREDIYDQFDDRMYMYKGKEFILESDCTTNPGGPILKGGWKNYTKNGAAIIVADEIYYDTYQASGTKDSNGNIVRKHHDKMNCLRQIKNLKYYRDTDNDKYTDESGPIYLGNYSTNIHFNNYSVFQKIKLAVKKFVGEWSAGCIVLNEQEPYETMYKLCKEYGKPVTLALLKEF